jgi:hypothetical protein
MSARVRHDSDRRMTDVLMMSSLRDVPVYIALSQLDRERLPRYIDMLRQTESNAKRLRSQLEALLAGSSGCCPGCGTAVTRADHVYCGALCHQRSGRSGEHRLRGQRTQAQALRVESGLSPLCDWQAPDGQYCDCDAAWVRPSTSDDTLMSLCDEHRPAWDSLASKKDAAHRGRV